MRCSRPKVLHAIAGRPLIEHVLSANRQHAKVPVRRVASVHRDGSILLQSDDAVLYRNAKACTERLQGEQLVAPLVEPGI